MSGVISFGSTHDKGRSWLCAGWGFRGILNRVIERNQDDEALVDRVQQAKYHNGLHFEILREEEPELAEKILRSLREAANETVAGDYRLRVNDRELDAHEYSRYRDAIAKLLKMIDNES